MAVYVAAAVLLGMGCATILVTCLAMTADLIGPHTVGLLVGPSRGWGLGRAWVLTPCLCPSSTVGATVCRRLELLGQGGQWGSAVMAIQEPAPLLVSTPSSCCHV